MFAKNIRYLRKRAELSQDKLAEMLGYKSFTTIQKWESGVSEPSMATAQKIANLLVPTAAIFGNKKEREALILKDFPQFSWMELRGAFYFCTSSQECSEVCIFNAFRQSS